MSHPDFPKGTKVYGRKGTSFARVAGVSTGGVYHCTLESCRGVRVCVRWPDGHITRPCSKGLIDGPRPGTYRIG